MDFPAFGGQGFSIDLLDEQIILLGDNKLGGTFEYKSIHQPRKGLLGMKFTKEVSPVGNSPLWHTSYAFGNQLLAIGGEFQSKARLSNSVWNGLNLRFKNGSRFSRFATGACKVKLAKDVFLLIGGFERVKESNVEMNTVLRLNITEETVEELPPIEEKRAFHACEISEGKILISGGTQGEVTVGDEVYSLTTYKSTALDEASSLGRNHHFLLRLEDFIFAFGGFLSNGSETSAVQWFNWTDKRWKHHEQSLLSENTTSLAVTAFPLSAVDCFAGCRCGISGNLGSARIVGGTEAQVAIGKEHLSLLLQENAFPWIVALIRDEDKSEDYISTSCSGTLVGFTVDPLIFISHRSGAPGWSQQPTVSTKMTNLWLQRLSQLCLDFMIGAKRRSLKGALK